MFIVATLASIAALDHAAAQAPGRDAPTAATVSDTGEASSTTIAGTLAAAAPSGAAAPEVPEVDVGPPPTPGTRSVLASEPTVPAFADPYTVIARAALPADLAPSPAPATAVPTAIDVALAEPPGESPAPGTGLPAAGHEPHRLAVLLPATR